MQSRSNARRKPAVLQQVTPVSVTGFSRHGWPRWVSATCVAFPTEVPVASEQRCVDARDSK